MAKVYVVNQPHEATAKVFATQYKHEADLLYTEVDQAYQANGDTNWYFVTQPHEATVKIYWVRQSHEAELKVFKVASHRAEWRSSNTLRNRLG